jgi:hypothetical protein
MNHRGSIFIVVDVLQARARIVLGYPFQPSVLVQHKTVLLLELPCSLALPAGLDQVKLKVVREFGVGADRLNGDLGLELVFLAVHDLARYVPRILHSGCLASASLDLRLVLLQNA